MSWSPPPLEAFSFTTAQKFYLMEKLTELQIGRQTTGIHPDSSAGAARFGGAHSHELHRDAGSGGAHDNEGAHGDNGKEL